ncbi:PA14 domain-containing protein [Paenibacillus assamensis]|uniref:PA14 domain-containing protein n=1 Tax=Paenibacillus assamensis TaxID=311244 RepID=UPI00040BB15A|nr:PA14 domain-containing protein [Paenibacillus assamensis]
MNSRMLGWVGVLLIFTFIGGLFPNYVSANQAKKTVKAAGTPVNGLKGEYYDNKNLTNLKLLRTDANIDFKWDLGSPSPEINGDTFSVRWTGYIQPKFSEAYTFYMVSDDGVRLWVNDQLLIDEWKDLAGDFVSKPIQLEASKKHKIRVEYLENDGNARTDLQWSSPSQPKAIVSNESLFVPEAAAGTGLRGEYFNNMDLTNLKMTRVDKNVNHSIGLAAPEPSMGVDTFSIRWTGQIVPKYTESYTFDMISDDGVRVWVNDQLVLDKWHNQAGEFSSKPISLKAGYAYNIRIKYYENGGASTAILQWSSSSQAKEVVPQSALYPPSSTSGVGLKGEYYSGKNFEELRMTRVDSKIDYYWEAASPNDGITNDAFSVRWTGYVVPKSTELYNFYMLADDGARVWINNQLVLDRWADQSGEFVSSSVPLVKGQRYEIRIEYYENAGHATSKLLWSTPTISKEIVPQMNLYPPEEVRGVGLTAEYFNNMELKDVVMTRTEPVINYAWAAESPASGINVDQFSVRWRGYIEPPVEETYTFHIHSDDGVRIWVNNQLILDKWADQSGEFDSIPIYLYAGQRYEIRVEYFENVGHATAILQWSSPQLAKEVIKQSQLYPIKAATGSVANDNKRRYAYDEQGKLISVTLPSGEDIHYSYDANGNLISRKR